MAQVVVTLKIMPDSPEADLAVIEKEASQKVHEFQGQVGKVEKEPIAFGLVALKILFTMSEDLGSTDELEAEVAQVDHVQSVEVTDVRRAIG
jgi:elongation factor 1-beta